jgi:hypothetical protein
MKKLWVLINWDPSGDGAATAGGVFSSLEKAEAHLGDNDWIVEFVLDVATLKVGG